MKSTRPTSPPTSPIACPPPSGHCTRLCSGASVQSGVARLDLATNLATPSDDASPDVGSEHAQLADHVAGLRRRVPPQQDVALHPGPEALHQDVGGPATARPHLLQHPHKVRVEEVVSWETDRPRRRRRTKTKTHALGSATILPVDDAINRGAKALPLGLLDFSAVMSFAPLVIVSYTYNKTYSTDDARICILHKR